MRERMLDLLDKLEMAKGGAEQEGAKQYAFMIGLQIDVLRYSLGYAGTKAESFVDCAQEMVDEYAQSLPRVAYAR